MGYEEALFTRDYSREQKSLQKKAKKKGLWGSVGRTLGGLAAAAFTGGMVNPVTLGLITGAGTLAGGAIGATASRQKLKGGTFMQEDRASLERELGSFGSRNITEALKGGVTAGIGQAAKLYGAGTKAAEAGKTAEEVSAIRRGAGFDFAESALGRGYAKLESFNTGRELQKMGEGAIGTTESIVGGVGKTLVDYAGGDSERLRGEVAVPSNLIEGHIHRASLNVLYGTSTTLGIDVG